MSLLGRNVCVGAIVALVWGMCGAGVAVAQVGAAYSVVEEGIDAGVVDEALGDSPEGIWLDGDVLWFAKRAAEGPWWVSGGVSAELARIGETDLWVVGLRWDRWDEAFLTAGFHGTPFPSMDTEFRPWRGERAPPSPERAEPGLVETFEIAGPMGVKDRSITVVLPPGYEGMGTLPALVLADGQSAEDWGAVVASMVLEGRCAGFAVIGVHSGGYEGDRSEPYDPKLDVRACEYLEGFDQARFDAHLDWVIDRVLPEVARRYPVSLAREGLGVGGFSNGGAFAASAGLRRGDVFGMSLALSVGVPPEVGEDEEVRARFYFAAGALEPRFLEHTGIARDRVVEGGGHAVFETFVGGHDPEQWILALSRFGGAMYPVE